MSVLSCPESPDPAIALWAVCSRAAPGEAPWGDFLAAMQRLRRLPIEARNRQIETAGIAAGWGDWCVAVLVRLQAEAPGTAEAFLAQQWNLRLTVAQASDPPDVTALSPAALESGDWESALRAVATMDDLIALAPAAVTAARITPQPALLPAFFQALDRTLAQKTPAYVPVTVLSFLPLALGDTPTEVVDAALGQGVLRARLSRLHRRLYQALLATDRGRPWEDVAELLLSLLLVETLTKGRHKALAVLFARAMVAPQTHTAGLRLMGEALYGFGIYQFMRYQDWFGLPQMAVSTCREVEIQSLLLNFRADGPADWYATLIEDLLLPNIRRASEAGRFLLAEYMEVLAVTAQKRPYSEENWRRIGDSYCDMIQQSCARILSPLREPAAPLPTPLRAAGRRIAFIMSNTIYAVGAGPVFQCLLLTLRALRQVIPDAFEIECVFTWCRPAEHLCHALADEGVAVTWYNDLLAPEDGKVDSMTIQAIQLKKEMRIRGIEVAIFTDCSRTFCYVASTICIAPVQIYWSMGWDWPNNLPMDGLLSFIPGTDRPVKTVKGQSWHLVRWMSRPLDPPNPGALRQYQALVSGYRRVLGTVCRSDKINSEPFVAILAQILRRCPGTCYLWTGNDNRPVRDLFEKYGIAERCIHAGVVRTADAMPTIDVFLDTFPVNNGHSTAEAMSAGRPVVSLLGGQSVYTYCLEPARLGWFGAAEQEAFNRRIAGPRGESLYLLTKTPDDYLTMACRLVDDLDFYNLAASACRALAEHCLFGAEGTAHSFHRAVNDILRAHGTTWGGDLERVNDILK